MYKNIHVVAVLQTQKFCQVEIAVHVLLVKRLLDTVCILLYFATEIAQYSQTRVEHYPLPEREIAVGQWPFSDQFSLFGQKNPTCYVKFTIHFQWGSH